MNEKTDSEFEALADHLTDPGVSLPTPQHFATGADATARGRELMLSEYGSQEALDEALRKAGRPRLGTDPKGASPTVRGRISEADFEAFKRLEAQTGKKQSELVREAVQLLLSQHQKAS